MEMMKNNLIVGGKSSLDVAADEKPLVDEPSKFKTKEDNDLSSDKPSDHTSKGHSKPTSSE